MQEKKGCQLKQKSKQKSNKMVNEKDIQFPNVRYLSTCTGYTRPIGGARVSKMITLGLKLVLCHNMELNTQTNMSVYNIFKISK